MYFELGVFGVVIYQMEEVDDVIVGLGDDMDVYYFKVGIRKQFNCFGDFVFYVEYVSYND